MRPPEHEAERGVVLAGPNAVMEALKAGRAVSKVVLRQGRTDSVARRVRELAASRGVPVISVPAGELTRLLGSPEHQGVLAVSSPARYVELDDLLTRRAAPLVFVVDGVTDPRNLGAVIRVADAVGSDGVVIPRRRAAQITEAVARSSAGAVAAVPVARVGNVAAALEMLKQRGLWVIGADAAGPTRFWEADLTVPLAVVLGGEDKGLAPLVRRRCDVVISIPMAGTVNSLNVSVAAAVIAYEALRQRSATST